MFVSFFIFHFFCFLFFFSNNWKSAWSGDVFAICSIFLCIFQCKIGKYRLIEILLLSAFYPPLFLFESKCVRFDVVRPNVCFFSNRFWMVFELLVICCPVFVIVLCVSRIREKCKRVRRIVSWPFASETFLSLIFSFSARVFDCVCILSLAYLIALITLMVSCWKLCLFYS